MQKLNIIRGAKGPVTISREIHSKKEEIRNLQGIVREIEKELLACLKDEYPPVTILLEDGVSEVILAINDLQGFYISFFDGKLYLHKDGKLRFGAAGPDAFWLYQSDALDFLEKWVNR